MNGLTVLIPAWNEEACIGAVVGDVLRVFAGHSVEVLVVDDGSTDSTPRVAEEAGARVISHTRNRGYGAALKTGLRLASHETIALLDADGQHRAEDLLRLVDAFDERFDMVIGARDEASFQVASRLPGKALLQGVAAFLVGERPDDVNSGMRVFRRSDALRYLSILPNGFSFSTTVTLAMIKDAFRVGFVPITVNVREGRRSTVRVSDGFRTLLLIVRIAMLFNPLKVFMPISGILIALGSLYAGWNLAREFNIPDGAVLSILAGIVVFFFGILADQMASIRRSH